MARRKRTRDDNDSDAGSSEKPYEGRNPRKKSRASHASRGEGSSNNNLHCQSLAHPIPTEAPPIVAGTDSQKGSVAEDAAQPSKKIRLGLEDGRDASTFTMPESHIFKLPPEIIGEILILTGSPRHILALARTCKHFCYTLIGEGAQYIWRRARCGSQCSFLRFEFVQDVEPGLDADIISLPDPPKTVFGEPAYAAFLFDPGTCDNCHKKTSAPYASFALRIRFCNDPLCRRLPDGLSNPEQFELIVPTSEKSDITANYVTYCLGFCIYKKDLPDLRTGPFPPTRIHNTLSRDTDIAKAREEFLSQTGGNEKRLEVLRTRNKEWMHFCSTLAKWQVSFNEKYRVVKGSNEAVGRVVADAFGWDYSDVIGCTVFNKICQHKNKLLENVVLSDIYALRDQIESELLALEEKRQRRKGEVALMKNRENVEALHNRLRMKKTYQYLPSLPTFRQLPIVQLLQAGIYDGNRNIADTLQNDELMRQRLDQEVKRWIETAKQDLAVVLGLPRHWKSANKKVLHPVERCTALFLCTKCSTTGYEKDGCLDFVGACRHVCQGKHGKNDRFRRSKHAAWKPGNFVKDEKAINLTKNALSKLKLSDETMTAFPLRQQVSAVICTSCEPSIVLDSKNMIGHCHRHESMEIFFPSKEMVTSHLNGFAFPYGIVEKFLRRGGQAIKKEIDKKNFGCRICLRIKEIAAVSEGPEISTGGEDDTNGSPLLSLLQCTLSERPMVMPPLFSFNGLRSHLKAKHGIEGIRDEDLFCSEQVKL